MGERTAHRRLTRIYGFVGFANKESACETGFSGDTSRPRVESVVVGGEERARKHRIRQHFGYRGPRQLLTRLPNL